MSLLQPTCCSITPSQTIKPKQITACAIVRLQSTVIRVAPQQPKDPILSMSPANTPLQHWLLWPTTVDGRIVQIVNVSTGLCADVAQLNQPPWTIELIQFTCKGKDQAWDNQRFEIVRNGEGHAQLLPVSPAKTVVYGPRMLGTQLTALPYQDGWAAGWLLSTVPGSEAEPEGAESATPEPPESPR